MGARAQPLSSAVRRRSTMCRLARTARAMIVSVGFFSGKVTNALPSTTNRFGTSWAWLNGVSTEVAGSAPMRHVPTSWLAKPFMVWSLKNSSVSALR